MLESTHGSQSKVLRKLVDLFIAERQGLGLGRVTQNWRKEVINGICFKKVDIVTEDWLICLKIATIKYWRK